MSDSSGILWPGDYRLRSESAIGSGSLACSLAMHLMVVALAILWPLWQGPRIDLSQAFIVSLVEAPPSTPATAPKGGPEAKAKEPAAPKPAPAKEEAESKADAKLVEAPPPKPAPAPKAEPKPEAKPEPKAKTKEEPAAEKALAQEKVPAAQKQRETQLAQALERIRTRVERDAALNAAISKVRQKVGTEAGSDGGSGVVAADFAGGSVPLSFRLYYEEVWERVRTNWALPSLRPQQLKAVVAIRIARDGSIERIELEGSSGDDRFDHSALSAVRASNPLPPLPGDYLGRWHEIGIRFHQ